MAELEQANPLAETVKPARSGGSRPFGAMLNGVQHAALWRRPWLGWVFVYAVPLLSFFVYRCIGLKPLILMYGSNADCTSGVEAAALALGFLEDLVCATYLACALWVFDSFKRVVGDRLGCGGDGFVDMSEKRKRLALRICNGISTFLVSWLLFVAMMAPFVADLLIVRLRDMRFTFELVAMAIHESSNASAAAISQSEIDEAYVNVAGLVVVATLFAIVRAWADWADLSRWNPAFALADVVAARVAAGKELKGDLLKTPHDKVKENSEEASLEAGDPTSYMVTTSPNNVSYSDATTDKSAASATSAISRVTVLRLCVLLAMLVLGLIVLPVIVLAASRACSSLVAYSGLNATLNELFIRGFDVTAQGFTPSVADGSIDHARTYVHSATEKYTLFKDDSLYRRTLGFQGDLAFDVNVTEENPPNVLLLVIESFRFHDSHYLVGEEDPSNLFKRTNITVTPNFDRWAKRGVAFKNMWSSWRTSRSVESLLFAQLPYDSVADSGMTGGKKDVELAGLPQLFKAKGYEPFFTTGCKTDYDDWNKFLPSHGFDTVWSRDEMMQLAEGYLNISSDDWYGDAHRALGWGVHDDLSFEILGDLLINKTKEQSERVAQGEAKKPLFINHYTISSHTPFRDRPKWYAETKKPNFSALYEGLEYADDVQAYLEMRYFTDMQLGKFLDRMSDEGILNDTIVVVVGDHGQAPEDGLDVPEAREISATRVAGTIIAEGRLGDYAGLMIDDAVEQYDMLNTLADITGVPEDGFLQDGIGRSLKRNITFGERIVYSNNPSRKMSVVRGHERLRYDRYSSSVLLHNADTDHEMKTDQFPALSARDKANWRTYRDNGRRINAYYTKRWDKKCLLAAEC
ncbi:sulfatase-like protein [Phytophthora cinnamomi]|uniref:sulfatase-like protein n=1 Tax=Phytophthora cinnamomi TaxID=4785 RepID=UPI00355ABF57|nr:sulfatase-like protein [Phytophthora cinnamomi]